MVKSAEHQTAEGGMSRACGLSARPRSFVGAPMRPFTRPLALTRPHPAIAITRDARRSHQSHHGGFDVPALPAHRGSLRGFGELKAARLGHVHAASPFGWTSSADTMCFP